MTRAEMLLDVYEDCGHTSSPPAAVAARVAKNLNKAYRMILGDPALDGLRNSLRERWFVSADGKRHYGVNGQISRIRGIHERDSDRTLQPITLDYIRTHDPGMTASGDPWAFVDMGQKPTIFPVVDTASNDGIWALSSSAADTTQTMELNAVTTGPSGDVTSTALNGQALTHIVNRNDILEIQTLRLSAACAGTVSLLDGAGGNLIAEIHPGQLTSNYRVIRLYPTPTQVIAYYADAEFNIVTLDDAGDIPILPEEFHDLLPQYAKALEYEMQRDPQYDTAIGVYRKRMSDLKYRMNVQHGEMLAVGSNSRRRGISRTGGMFPVDTY